MFKYLKSTNKVFLIMLLVIWYFSSILFSGFPSFNTVRVRASRLNNQSEFVTHTEQPQGLFPNLTFSCSGEITRIWYIGKVVNGATVTISPNFQLWSSRVPSTVYQQIQPVTSLVDSTSLSSVIQLTSMQTNSFRYEDGYVFGTSYSSLMRRSDLLYLPSSRPTAYFGSTTTNLSTNTIQFSLSQLGIEINNDYPLIAVETGIRYFCYRYKIICRLLQLHFC